MVKTEIAFWSMSLSVTEVRQTTLVHRIMQVRQKLLAVAVGKKAVLVEVVTGLSEKIEQRQRLVGHWSTGKSDGGISRTIHRIESGVYSIDFLFSLRRE